MDGAWAPQSPSSHPSYAPEEAPVHPQQQGYRASVSHIAPQFITPSSSPPQPHKPAPRSMARDESMQDAEYMPDAPVSDNGKSTAARGASTLPPNVDDIVIKNHFPVARIKRIMQADDDVGKVAQVTPVVVCRYPGFTYAIHI
jgi:hypothetical protein